MAVGGYGRRELSPRSDLDVVLVHTDGTDVGRLAGEVWYPLWDAGADLDHAVRSLPEAADAAGADLRVALGMLDARHLAGDPAVTLQLRSVLLAQWRRDARARLPELRDLVETRGQRFGELAHQSVPDLKESGGGLRDTTVLNALRTTWLVDVPHGDLDRCRQGLLDVRDALHAVTGRGADRIGPDVWPDLGAALGLDGPEAAQQEVRRIGRRLTHLSRVTWRRVDGVLAPGRVRPRTPGPVLHPLGGGLAETAAEAVVQPGTDPAADPALLLRAAALAAERELVLSPHTIARLLRECPALPEPWPEEARDLLVRLLAAGPGLLTVWETLDETGAVDRLMPEWDRVRLLPHASVVHRFTVDRHLVETCIEASRLVRRVSRPDLLLVSSLLHDIGKGGRLDHSVAGETVAAQVARRLGFTDEDVAVIAALVRRHLLLVDVATGRDLEDPSTIEHVRSLVADPLVLDLLAALTEADARATSAKAWTTWRSALVGELVSRVRESWEPGDGPEQLPEGPPVEVPDAVRHDEGAVVVHVEATAHGSEVTVVSRDRAGLLAAVSGALTLLRAPVRAARAWSQDEYAVSRWHVEATHLDPAVVRQQVEAVLSGRLDPAVRLPAPALADLEPAVAVRADASRRATVLEVRTQDRPGVVHLVCRSLAAIGVAVRSAHVATLGPQAVDVFYLQEDAAGALGDERAAEAAHAVRGALTGPVTLGV